MLLIDGLFATHQRQL